MRYSSHVCGRLDWQRRTVAWICLTVGIVALLGVGVLIGLYLTFRKTTQDGSDKIPQVSNKIEKFQDSAVSGSLKNATDQDAATDVRTQAEAAKSLLQDISGIIGALPEKLRFAGLLVVVGVVLMSVATV